MRLPSKLAAILAAVAFLTPLPAPAQDKPAQEKLTVLLDWFVNPDHAPLVVAKQKGFFERAGLDVTLIEPADPSAPPRLVAAGQGDVAVSYQPKLYAAVTQGIPILRFGTLIGTPLTSLVALEGGPIRSLADLKGRTVGYSTSGIENAVLGAMLGSVGLKLDDVKFVNVNFALTPALLSGRVDAVIGAFRNFELTELQLAGKKGIAFFPEEHGVPPYDELIYVARADRVAEPKLRRFLDAVEAATVYILNHSEEAWTAFTAAYPKTNDKLNRQAWLDTLPRFQASPAAFDPERYRRFGAFMKEKGLIEKVEPLERYVAPAR